MPAGWKVTVWSCSFAVLEADVGGAGERQRSGEKARGLGVSTDDQESLRMSREHCRRTRHRC